MADGRSNFWNYLKAFRHHWATEMSGAFSVPFTIAALYSQGRERFVYGLLAISAFVYASYRIWAIEHAKVIERQPALQIEYDPRRCCEMKAVSGTNYTDYSFSVIISSLNTVNPISGVIVGLEELGGADSFSHNNRPFKFKHYPENSQVTCNPGEKITVDILWYLGNKKKWWLCFQDGSLELPGVDTYFICLRTTGGGANPDYKKYRFGIRDEVPYMEAVS
jgi:hypothetical protein